jgi:ribosomal protein L30/L7E
MSATGKAVIMLNLSKHFQTAVRADTPTFGMVAEETDGTQVL